MENQLGSVLRDIGGITELVLIIDKGYNLHMKGGWFLDGGKGILTCLGRPETPRHAVPKEKITIFCKWSFAKG